MSLAYWLRQGPAEPVEEGTIQFGPGKGLPKLVFNGLDGSQNMVRKIATLDPVRKKIILIQPGDKALYLSGLREAGIPGYLYLFAHARPDRIQGAVNIQQIANVVRRSGFWHGQPILVDACNAGALPHGAASVLALTLGTYVTAPTTTTWNHALGGPAVGQGPSRSFQEFFQEFPSPIFCVQVNGGHGDRMDSPSHQPVHRPVTKEDH